MSYNASNVYTTASGSTTAFPGQVIASATWNAIFTDIASGLTTVGQAVSRAGNIYCTATGTNAIALTIANAFPAIPAYVNGQKFTFKAPNTTSGATTIQVGALAALKAFLTSGAQIGSGDFTANEYVEAVYLSTLDTGAGGFVVDVGALDLGSATGILSLVHGGTNAALTAANGAVVFSNATGFQLLSADATAGRMLRSGANVVGSFSTNTWPDATPINNILYATSANVIGNLATANNAVLGTGGTGIPVLSATLPVGLVIGSLTSLSIRNTAAAFDLAFISNDAAMSTNRSITFSTQNGSRSIDLAGNLTLGGSLTTSGAFATTFTMTAGTAVTFPTSGTLVNTAVTTLSSLVSIGTITTGVWTGTTIAVANGGTGNTTFTAFSVICAGTTATGAFQNVSGVGSAGQVLTSNGAGALPTWQAASAGAATLPTQQVFTTGTGATYTRPTSPTPVYIRVRLIGGGGGGAGSGTTPGATGNGTASTFNALSANGGSGAATVFGGAGGALAGVGSQGGDGNAALNAAQSMGGQGGASFFGSGGQAGPNGPSAGGAAGPFGAGGGGAGCAATTGAGGGGGSGGYREFTINAPASTYTYTVGAGGAGGTLGTSGAAGGNGKGGLIIVDEYYI